VKRAIEKLAATVETALQKSDWKVILQAARQASKMPGRCSERAPIAEAVKQARQWAADEFDAIVQAAAAGGDLTPLRKRLGIVRQHFAGEPEAVEVDVGMKALQRLQLVREIEVAPNPAKDLRPRSAEPYKGTRWAGVFVSASVPPGK
jgi:hypothetical protein